MTEESERRQEDTQELNFRQLFEQYAYYWKWFIICVIICSVGAFVYLRYTPQIFNVQTKVLLQDEKQASGDLVGLSELASLTGGGSQTSAFIADQIDVIKSRRILAKVIVQNKFNIIYRAKGNIKRSELLERESPVKLVLLESTTSNLDSIFYQIKINFDNNKIKINDRDQFIDN